MEISALCDALGAPARVSFELERQGWTVERLGTLQDVPREELFDLVDHINELAEIHLEIEVSNFKELVEAAAAVATRRWREQHRAGEAVLLEAHHGWRREIKRRRRSEREQQAEVEKIPRLGRATAGRWPTRLGRRIAGATGGERERESIEKEERKRWLRELKQIMVKANMPVAKELRAAGHVLETERFGKGRRASTLRKHVKVWHRVQEWMLETFGYPWPRRPEEFACFLEARAQEPSTPAYRCPRSRP